MKNQSQQTFTRRFVYHIQGSSPFFEWMCAFILFGGVILSVFPKASIHLFINQHHSPAFDIFFTLITLLGDGVSAAILVFLLLFVRFRYALMAGVSNIACSIIVHVSKHLVFPDSVRPYQYFKGIHDLYLVPGIEVYSFNSFPSGHSATIFTTCTLLCLMTKHRLHRVLLFLLACVTAFSRVYLSQHFFADIYAGAIIGVLAAYTTAAYFGRRSGEDGWLENSLVSKLKR